MNEAGKILAEGFGGSREHLGPAREQRLEEKGTSGRVKFRRDFVEQKHRIAADLSLYAVGRGEHQRYRRTAPEAAAQRLGGRPVAGSDHDIVSVRPDDGKSYRRLAAPVRDDRLRVVVLAVVVKTGSAPLQRERDPGRR
ncbi:hypothetical protein SDC9_156470 [bioreactor metagenome]|uniref:Uncharacterized protein n=1 Tax=bioreactor metagenome TaxID=1076179 RepID=A0A645F6N5_9ZZZZ